MSMKVNEPYQFDGNLILACSQGMQKKGYKTAGTTIKDTVSSNRKFQFYFLLLTSQ